MRCGVITRKLGMSRVFNDNGEHVPVTVLRMEDVEVLSIKSIEKEGYSSVQLGFCNKKPKNISKPLRGVFAKVKSQPKEKVAEFRVSQDAILNVGDKLGGNHFIPGQNVDVVGVMSKTKQSAEESASLARSIGVGSNARAYDSITEMIADPEIEALWICSPNFARIEAFDEID